MDETELYRAPRRRGTAGTITALLIAFIAGIALTVALVRHWDRIATLVRPQTAAAPLPQTITRPPAILVAQPQPAAAAGEAELAGRIAAIEARVGAIDARADEARGDADRAEGLLVAFAARRALDRGQPLGFLEGMLRVHFGAVEPQAVAMVVGAAQRPVTLVQLQERWATLAPSFASASTGGSWWGGVQHEIGNLFVVHRADASSATPIDRNERIGRLLEQARVSEALGEVARLPASSDGAVWIASARRYVLARNALDRIETAALLRPPASSAATSG